MADGVLDQGLQNEVRHGCVEDVAVGVDRHGQPVSEPDLLDSQIGPDEIELLLERYFLLRHAIEHAA